VGSARTVKVTTLVVTPVAASCSFRDLLARSASSSESLLREQSSQSALVEVVLALQDLPGVEAEEESQLVGDQPAFGVVKVVLFETHRQEGGVVSILIRRRVLLVRNSSMPGASMMLKPLSSRRM
jgi:hypothetical protein